MIVQFDVFFSARGKARSEGKCSLEVESELQLIELHRILCERRVDLARVSEELRVIRSNGVLLKHADSPVQLRENEALRAVFIERKTRTHVDDIRPFMGLTTGGAKIQVTGENFDTTVRMVRFGIIEVEAVRYSSNLLTCIAPPHEPGVVSVEVPSPGEGYTSDGLSYTYVNSIAEGAEIAICNGNETGALNPVGLESCRPIDPFRRDD